ncbi:MAG: GDSL-type esterase/lipase family protein [Thermovirgaceae bacterium]
MTRQIGFALLFLVLLLPVGAFAANIAPLGSHSLILAFGDSITYGTGAPAGKSYPKRLEERLGVPVVNAGVPGEVSEEGLKRLSGLLEKHRPTLVVLCHGGNDLIRGLPLEKTSENLHEMARAVKRTATDLVIVGVPEPGLSMTVPSFYEKIAHETGALYEGRSLRRILLDSSLKSDLIHPNAAGYARLAEDLAVLVEGAQW